MMRKIKDQLNSRKDLSPFLIHLTKDIPDEVCDILPGKIIDAKDALENIITEKKLYCAEYRPNSQASKHNMSVARYAIRNQINKMNIEEQRDLLSAISFTETPLDKIKFMIDIEGCQVDLKPYGLVFLKDNLVKKGISPVLYFNNYDHLAEKSMQRLCECLIKDSNKEIAMEILPLISFFGHKIGRSNTKYEEKYDFFWEREWRLPHVKGPFEFKREDIFVGLCPHEFISFFEDFAEKNGLKDLTFIDPCINLKQYKEKLDDLRNEIGLKNSVV